MRRSAIVSALNDEMTRLTDGKPLNGIKGRGESYGTNDLGTNHPVGLQCSTDKVKFFKV